MFCAGVFAAEPLPALDAELPVTVSGVSSGGYFAVQFHVAHSAIVQGAGAIAGGPYYCAQGSIKTAYYNCMTPSLLAPLPSIAVIRSETEDLARAGRIDPTSNLASGRAWLFTGLKDRIVTHEVVEGLNAFYAGYKTHTVIVRDKPAGHAMVTLDAGNKDCGASQPPFINDCDYDAAGELLKHLLGDLAPPSVKSAGGLASFDQSVFGGERISMDDEAFIYVPSACKSQRCRVHVAFHGCRQGRAAIKDQFARDAGYNRWADTNRIIVLYPQAIARSWPTYNPNGCWDWWGYTGVQYHTKDGAQIRAVMAMLERLSEPKK